MDIVLVAGLWLPSTVWADVVVELDRLGHRGIPVALPGVDDSSSAATLDDQLHALLAVVDDSTRPLVVGHSAASTLAWMVGDRRPNATAGLVLVGGFPTSSGQSYAEFFEVVDGTMDFPGWEAFEGPDSADLSEHAKASLTASAVPVPAGVAQAVVELTDEARFEVPTVLVCPEYTPEQAQQWIGDGAIPELERVSQLSFVNIDSGHWPMITRPAELAGLLADVAQRLG